MLTGTPELYASILTIRIHQEWSTVPVSINYLHIWIFSHGSYSHLQSLFTEIWTPTIITVTTIITFYAYIFTRDRRAHTRACMYSLYIHTHIHIPTPTPICANIHTRTHTHIYKHRERESTVSTDRGREGGRDGGRERGMEGGRDRQTDIQ